MTEAERERAAVVTWLRKEARGSDKTHHAADLVAATLRVHADAIERGEHLPAGE